jgi:hypothetical protein
MKHKENTNNASAGAPVLDFISGKTNTSAAKRLTKSIGSLQSLWQLAKMTGIVKKCSKN